MLTLGEVHGAVLVELAAWAVIELGAAVVTSAAVVDLAARW